MESFSLAHETVLASQEAWPGMLLRRSIWENGQAVVVRYGAEGRGGRQMNAAIIRGEWGKIFS